MPEQQVIQVAGTAGFVKVDEKVNSSVVRAISIATEQKFDDVKAELLRMARHKRNGWRGKSTIRNTDTYQEYLTRLGWQWTATMQIGSGCKVHLSADELPTGRLIVRISKRLVAVIDGTIHDITDPSRAGKRCVYGYWSKP